MSGIQYMLETEYGKAIAIAVVAAFALVVAVVLKVYNDRGKFL